MVLTKSEMEVMDVFWAVERPLCRSDLLELSGDKNWKDSSVYILLNDMLKKGVIREAGYIKRSKTYGRTFEPTLTREQYYIATVFANRKKPDVVALVEALLARDDITTEQMEKIKALVANK